MLFVVDFSPGGQELQWLRPSGSSLPPPRSQKTRQASLTLTRGLGLALRLAAFLNLPPGLLRHPLGLLQSLPSHP
jgi:hypothetical protein